MILERLLPLKPYLLAVGAMSVAVNLLLLVPPMYMLTVFDRAVSSRSEATLLMLTLIMFFLLAGLGFIAWSRTHLMQRAAARFQTLLAGDLFDVGYRSGLSISGSQGDVRALNDMQALKRFIAGPVPLAIFDAPFTPVFIVVMFLFHPLLGFIAIFSLLILVALNIINERINAAAVHQADAANANASAFVQKNFSNAEIIESMGMMNRIRARWQKDADRALALQLSAGERSGVLSSISRAVRLISQSLILGAGAYLVIKQSISPGMMIAGSVLLARALGPVDALIGGWTGFVAARDQFERLSQVFQRMPEKRPKTLLPPPKGSLAVEKAVVAAPGSNEPILRGVSFALHPGSHLGVVGPSGAGKSTLARALLGLWPCMRGSIRLDGADIYQWDREQLGAYIGYLPQSMELLDGTISDNIARMGEWKSEDVVEAAKTADVHDMILRLPQGYDTVIGSRSGMLSGGQLQRIGLARALYGRPKFVVLDEPNTNLDQAGERALVNAFKRLKAMGTTMVVISHNTRVLAHLDTVMILKKGQIADFDKAGKILARYESAEQADASSALTGEKRKKPLDQVEAEVVAGTEVEDESKDASETGVKDD